MQPMFGTLACLLLLARRAAGGVRKLPRHRSGGGEGSHRQDHGEERPDDRRDADHSARQQGPEGQAARVGSPGVGRTTGRRSASAGKEVTPHASRAHRAMRAGSQELPLGRELPNLTHDRR